jgi:hypothetical protein
MGKRKDRMVFSFENVVALLISVCLSVYTWIIVMKGGYGGRMRY